MSRYIEKKKNPRNNVETNGSNRTFLWITLLSEFRRYRAIKIEKWLLFFVARVELVLIHHFLPLGKRGWGKGGGGRRRKKIRFRLLIFIGTWNGSEEQGSLQREFFPSESDKFEIFHIKSRRETGNPIKMANCFFFFFEKHF